MGRLGAGLLGTYRYGATLVEVFDGLVRVTLPDGTTVHAVPNHTEEDVARAHALGYSGDVWAMTRDHDHFHAMLANTLGLRESPALRAAVTGHDTELSGAEEEVVLALQRFVNMCRREGKL